jgi:hypothetical protein
MNLLDALPAIGTFLAGPAGGLAASGVQWLAEKFGASEATVDGIKQTLAGMKPEQLLEAKKLDIEFQKFCLDHGIKLQLAQIAVNVEEAKSSSLWVAGWRPGVGWICAVALAYAAVLEPVLRFVAQVAFGYAGAFPAIDTNITMQILLGMLGIAGLRSYDKKNGVSS